MAQQEDTVQVFRLVEYIGPRSQVEEQIEKSLHGTRDCGRGLKITAVTIGDFPRLLAEREEQPNGPTQEEH